MEKKELEELRKRLLLQEKQLQVEKTKLKREEERVKSKSRLSEVHPINSGSSTLKMLPQINSPRRNEVDRSPKVGSPSPRCFGPKTVSSPLINSPSRKSEKSPNVSSSRNQTRKTIRNSPRVQNEENLDLPSPSTHLTIKSSLPVPKTVISPIQQSLSSATDKEKSDEKISSHIEFVPSSKNTQESKEGTSEMKSVEKEEVIDAKKMTNKKHVDVMRSKLKKLGEVETSLVSKTDSAKNEALVSKSSKDDVKRRGAKKMSLEDMRAKLPKQLRKEKAKQG